MALDLRPFPDLDASLLALVVWAVGMALLVGTVAATRRLTFLEAASRVKYALSLLAFVGAFHAMAGFRAAQLIAAAELVVLALLWVLARTLPPRVLEDEEPVDGRR